MALGLKEYLEQPDICENWDISLSRSSIYRLLRLVATPLLAYKQLIWLKFSLSF